jgi:hypothetical protein
MLRVAPEIVVKWLASQDYAAVTVALRAAGLKSDLFGAIASTLPWRDMPTHDHQEMMVSRFEALDEEEARNIFELWRAHSFRRRSAAAQVHQPEAMSA